MLEMYPLAPYKAVLLDEQLAGPGNVEFRLETLFGRLESFCKRNGYSLHMSKLTKTLVHYPNEKEYPCGMLGMLGRNVCFVFY